MTKTLNETMGIDHVVEVHADGSVTDTNGLYAPELFEGELLSSDWEFFSTGYSGQDRYNGPIMHNSEFIGGGLERDILTNPGIYVAVASYYDNDDEDLKEVEPTIAEGWAVLRLKETP